MPTQLSSRFSHLFPEHTMREHHPIPSQFAAQVCPVVQVAPAIDAGTPFRLDCAEEMSERRRSERQAIAATHMAFMVVPPDHLPHSDLIRIPESGNGRAMRHLVAVP